MGQQNLIKKVSESKKRLLQSEQSIQAKSFSKI